MGEGSATILLVDDEPLVLDALTRHVQLRRRGWRVLRAEDGAEALRTVDREPVDAIVTDVQMPGKDGFALLAALCAHERHRNIPVLVLTGLAGRSVERRVLAGGAIDLLRKPVDVRELLLRLDRALEGKRARDRQAADHDALVTMMRTPSDARPKVDVAVDAVRKAILSSLSHELLTPLTSIRASAEILGLYDQVPREEFIGIILTEARRMTRLVGSLLDLVAIESGDALPLSSVSPRALARECRRRAIPLLRSRGLSLRVIVEGEDRRVLGNAHALGRVLDELVANAARFTRDGGRVRLRISDRGRAVRVEVLDQGAGFSAAEAECAPALFWQRGDGLTDKTPGLGVGLALCRGVLSRHQSRLGLDCAEGGGRVYFDLPAAESLRHDGGEASRLPSTRPEVTTT